MGIYTDSYLAYVLPIAEEALADHFPKDIVHRDEEFIYVALVRQRDKSSVCRKQLVDNIDAISKSRDEKESVFHGRFPLRNLLCVFYSGDGSTTWSLGKANLDFDGLVAECKYESED